MKVDVLLAKLLYSHAFNLYEWAKDDFNSKVLGNSVIKRLIASGFGL
jgi:hypothetical protein